MKKNYPIVLLLNLLFTFPLIGQNFTIIGTVKDANQKAIEFANVLVQSDAEQSFQRGTITDASGQFQILIPETGTVSYTHLTLPTTPYV